ncbi:hypothetical protein MF265_22285 [Serratia marcescens]|uniref:hypothetical protein n=1 Tax=Serratia marcescens TaxID=615 RepID=UPI001EEF7C02|nr:hypothetical protein [Serratia marcescens]ULH10615.1 hypothetical protein MF265_22285 [Serratia marcescens]
MALLRNDTARLCPAEILGQITAINFRNHQSKIAHFPHFLRSGKNGRSQSLPGIQQHARGKKPTKLRNSRIFAVWSVVIFQ